MKTTLLIAIFLCVVGCSTDKEKILAENDVSLNLLQTTQVSAVKVTGEAMNYNFAVTVESQDTGCDQYADWWEVIDADQSLVYRRILAHSHVMEQPFTRDGGGVTITSDQTVYIRVHMNNSGYATLGLSGSVDNGFKAVDIDKSFAKEVESEAPQPSGCAF